MLGVGNEWGRGNGERNERSKAIATTTFRVGSITQPPTSVPSANNEASAIGENLCVHQSSIGWEERGSRQLAPTGGRSEDACPYESE